MPNDDTCALPVGQKLFEWTDGWGNSDNSAHEEQPYSEGAGAAGAAAGWHGGSTEAVGR